jgi:hypothetical protein
LARSRFPDTVAITMLEEANRSSISRKLLKALSTIDRPGSFCSSGSLPAVLPGLNVKGFGQIALPLTSAQVKSLKSVCEQAPHGQGEKTVVDTSVRCVWRLKPDRFSLTNPAWSGLLDQIVTRVQGELGLKGQKLDAHLYDLLLYEKGGFFLPHRDGEKLDRMVATLIVVLPSSYEGGELVIRHEGQEENIDFSGPQSEFQVHFAAFYADCEHEVKPLLSGHRLCLVYNLVLAKSKKPIGAPRKSEHIAEIKQVLAGWKDQPKGPVKLAVSLEHRYTEAGLSWDALKGIDAARARILAEAAGQAGCQAHLALLTLHESGEADEMYYEGYGRRGRSRYSSYDDDDDDEEEEDDDDDDDSDTDIKPKYKMGEVYDTSLTADHWHSPDGDDPGFGEIPVEREEIVPPESITNVKPEEDFQGPTGNEGMPLERWYRRAAVVLWPDDHHLDVLCQVGSRQALPALAKMISSWSAAKGANADALKQRCLRFAGLILAKWPEHLYRRNPEYRLREEEGKTPDLAAMLNRLDDPGLIQAYVGDVLVKDLSLDPGAALVKSIARHGWATFTPQLLALFKATVSDVVERNAALFERLCLAVADGTGGKAGRTEAKETCEALGRAMLDALKRIDVSKDRAAWEIAQINRTPTLVSLVGALLAAGLDGLLVDLLAHVQSQPKYYGLREVQLPTLAKLGPWLKETNNHAPQPLLDWIGRCRGELESLTEHVPQPPGDFRREANISCKCDDCAELIEFLLNPGQPEHGFQMKEERRRHLLNSAQRCDLKCRTDTRPRPQILVCTKTTASFEKRLKQYHDDERSLADVKALQARLSG